VAALLGLPVPAGLPGRNVLASGTERPAFSMTLGGRLLDGRGGEIVSVRTPEAKLIWAPNLGHYQLFDLVRDPGEREDRWGDGTAAAALARLLSEWRAPGPPPPPPPAGPGVGGRPPGAGGGGWWGGARGGRRPGPPPHGRHRPPPPAPPAGTAR